MVNVKKGQLVPARGRWKHLRPFGKRLFWRRERGAVRKLLRRETG